MSRLLAILILFVLAWCGMGKAHAQDYPSCYDVTLASGVCPDRQTATAQASAAAEWRKQWAGEDASKILAIENSSTVGYCWSNNGVNCLPSTGATRSWVAECTGGKVWNPGMRQCQQDCKVKQPFTGGFTPPNGSIRCDGGCDVVYNYNGDGTSTATPTGGMCAMANQQQQCAQMQGYYWHPTLNSCVPVTPDDCKPGQDAKEGVCNKPEECPEGMKTDENGLCKRADPECPAGATKGPDGSCVDDKNTCKAGEAKKNDGTCGKDDNNDGTADDEDNDPSNDSEKNEFYGGDDCRTPPTCSGDAILCGQARIQWRIECNTRQNVNLSGGGCNNPPQCQGEKCTGFEMAQLIQQWRTACAVEGLKNTGGGDNGQQPEWTKVGGMTQDPGQGANSGDTDVHSTETVDGSQLDASGFVGGGGSCPGFGVASGGGELAGSFLSELATPPPFFCNFISWIYAITVLLFGVLPSLYILAGYKGS